VVPQAYFVDKIAGDSVDVTVMIPPGASPATYEPTLEQIEAISRARLYIEIGHPHFPFEATWLDRLLRASRGVKVVDSSAGIELENDRDPHLWVSPRNVRVMARNIEAAMATAFPENAKAYRTNLQRFLTEIDALDAELGRILAPARGREFFVFHPAWGYLAAEYGLKQVAVEQQGKEPDARTVAELIKRARAKGVKVIFVQPQFSRASAELVAQEIGARVEVIDPLARDWAENLRVVARRIAAEAR
jgi:zinc transport system substrate-binding protein